VPDRERHGIHRRRAGSPLVSGAALLFLALPGGLAAHASGANVTTGAIRVTFWGALAMR
jgi:VIT1/CCC1 family predicted Fe2+/Mn2+ transporter